MSTSQPPSTLDTSNGLRLHSCVLCRQRKVKCDKKDPCSGCVKAGVECTSSAPAPPRRRRKRLSETELRIKVKRYEELLKSYGAKIDGLDVSIENDVDTRSPTSTISQIGSRFNQPSSIMEDSTSSGAETVKYAEEHREPKVLNCNLWTTLGDEFRNPRETTQRSYEDEIFLSLTPDCSAPDGSDLLLSSNLPDTNLRVIYPRPDQAFKLWTIFLENVNPLSKLLHVHTMQRQILIANHNFDALSESMMALIFAIYTVAVASLSNANCESMLGESRSTLLTRYSTGTQHALVKVGFMKSNDMIVLQAFVIFLLSSRQYYDPHALWILTGVAVRMAQRIGLHRDGTLLNLSVFETEMRRRLWWQLLMLDGRSGQLSGSETSMDHITSLSNTKVPLNINDSDLSPEMEKMPQERIGMTEMSFCLVRYEFGRFIKTSKDKKSKLISPVVPLSEKDKIIEEIENIIESKFMRYCDPCVPLHLLSASMARSAICKLRLMAHHPRQYSDHGASLSQEEKDMLFTVSLKMVEYDTLCQSMKSMQGFLWHINIHFHLDTFVFILIELRHRTSGELADRAWQQITEVYKHHPEIITGQTNALYVAVGNLTLQAWGPRETELIRQFQRRPEVPGFISTLLSQRMMAKQPKSTTLRTHNNDLSMETGESIPNESQASNLPQDMDLSMDLSMGPTTNEFDLISQFDSLPMDLRTMDWEIWDDLLQNNELWHGDNHGQ